MPISGTEGINDGGQTGYTGPKPPSDTHRYIFKLFAVNTMLEFPEGSTVDREALYNALEDKIVEEAENNWHIRK